MARTSRADEWPARCPAWTCVTTSATGIRSSDVARLTRIPGVGKKTAERVVLELKDRLPTSIVAAPETADASEEGDDVRADLLSALSNLGYQRGAVEKTVDKVLGSAEDRSFEPLLRAILKQLVGR